MRTSAVDNLKNDLSNTIDKFGDTMDERQTKVTDSFKGLFEQIKRYLFIAFIIVLLIVLLLALNLCTNLFICVHTYRPLWFKHQKNSLYNQNNGNHFELATPTATKNYYQRNSSANHP
ncbi:unnamed protein product [Didymodactylos carnosus]|uniref:Uncharacterized protein n=1 Tax=Didymodactylos carnosus TaxID=1234261 RepID=A0A815FDA1_9BILA|nr:unnamed protein product [Didymodactylos carnosus]CAF4171719.1 unnamed protein product [Didymodactylos carnosus]